MSSKHTHNYILVREVVRGVNHYYFWECANSGCPKPNRMTVNDMEPPK